MTRQTPVSAAYQRRHGHDPSGLALKALPWALALCFAPVVRAQLINDSTAGLPRSGSVTAGVVGGVVNGNQLTLTQTGSRAVIDWQSFNIDPGRTVQFVQPAATAAVLNRVPASAGLSEINGTLTANGMVLLMNPNGVLFKSGASINVGSLIATSGTVNQTDFMAGGSFGITGANAGSVTNQGTVTASGAGLVALVAPSVSNQGAITATGGRIALSGADRATVTLNGGLYEFAVPSGALGTNATVANAAAARLDGANLLLSTGDAAHLVSGVINLQGVQQASSAMVVNGNTVVLTSDLNAPAISGSSNAIQVQAGASIQDAVKIAKTGTPGAGATVTVQAGSYAEQLTLNKANLTLSGQAGAKLVVPDLAEVNGIAISANNVKVEGLEIAGPLNTPYYDYYAVPKSNISRGIAVGDGITGFTIGNNNIHDVRNGILIHGRNSTGSVSGNTIDNTKSGISVQYTDAAGITIANNREGVNSNEWGVNLHLNGHLDGAGNILSNSTPIAASPTTAWQQSLLNLSTANAGWAVQDQGYLASNRTQANVATTGAASNQGSRLAPINTVQGGIDAVVAGGRVTVKEGSYAEAPTLSKALTLQGDTSVSRPVIELPAGTSGTLTVQASNVTVQGLQISKQDQVTDAALVNIPRGGSFPNYTIAYSNVRLNDLVFSKGRRAAFITGQNVTVENSSFSDQLRDALYFDAVAGTTTIRNNQFSGAAGSKKAILIEGFTGIPASSGTVNVTGNTLDGKDNFFVYDAWSTPASRVSLNLTNNKIISTSGDGIALYDPRVDGVSIDPASFAKISSAVVSGNDLSGVPAGKYAVVGISDATYPVAVNASGNWWGTANPAAVSVSGPVDYTPMLATGTDTSASTPGFQGDAASLIVHAQGQQSGSTTRVQEGINLVQAGGTVQVAAGSYAQPSTLSVTKSLTLAGAGEAATTIDAHGIGSGYGLSVSADDVTLRDFTFYGPSAFYASAYGIKVSPGGSADARLRNFTINRVTSRGAGKAELDLNGVDGALIDQVTLNGAPVGNDTGTTQGAGLQLTDSANVTVRNTSTLNNAWGGVALYQANRSYNQQVNHISIDGSNHFAEANPVYLQDESALYDFGTLSIAGFGYAVRNAASIDSAQYTWLQATQQKAYDYAVNLPGASASYIQGWDGAAATQSFQVGVGNLTAGGTQAMSIGAALDHAGSGANIDVAAGTYPESVTVNSRYNWRFNDATVHGLTLNAGAGDTAISGRVSADSAAGLVFNAAVSLQGDTTLATQGANISLNGDVRNADAGPYALSLLAGSGATRGDVSMTTGGSASSPLGLLSVSSRRFTLASTLWVQGYSVDALGDVALSNHTLNAMDAGSSSTLTSAGDVTGSTTSKGSVALVSSGNVQANVTTDGSTQVTATNISGNIASKGNVDLQGSGDVSSAVTTDGATRVTATNISGSIVGKGSVDLQGSGNVATTVTADGATKVTATNISGSIVSKGNVDLQGSGDVSSVVTTDGSTRVAATNISGSIASKGNVDLQGSGNVSSAVTTDGSTRVTAANISGSIVGKGSVDLAGNGDVSATVTADGAAKVTATNISGNIASKTDVNLQGSGDVTATVAAGGGATVAARNVSGAIAGRDVAVTAQEKVDVAVTATNSATLAGDSVHGSVSAQSATVQAVNQVQMSLDTTTTSVRSEGTVNLSGSSDQVSIDAPHGSVGGDFGQVSNAGSGLFSVNGKPELNPVLSTTAENGRVNPLRPTVLESATSTVTRSLPRVTVVALGRDARIERSSPAAAGDALEQGLSVEIDLAPGRERERP